MSLQKMVFLISRPYKQIFKQTNFQPFRLKKYPLIPTEAVDVFTYGYSFDKRGFNEWAISGIIIDEPRIEKQYYPKAPIDVSPGSSGSPVLGQENIWVGIATPVKI